MGEEEVTVKVKEEKQEKPVTEEDVQQKLILYQLLERQGESLKQQLQLIEQRLLELNSTKEAIDNIKPKPGDIMIPLGSGIYTKGQTTGELIADLGSGVMLGKDKAAVKGHIGEMTKMMDDSYKEVEKQMLSVIEKMNEIALDIQEMSRKIEKQASS
jgi:prefoldin alpha subunit